MGCAVRCTSIDVIASDRAAESGARSVAKQGVYRYAPCIPVLQKKGSIPADECKRSINGCISKRDRSAVACCSSAQAGQHI